jgi:hypothetical protein
MKNEDNYVENYYVKIWNSLSTNELLSMRKSNVFSKELIIIYKRYLMIRNIMDLIPILTLVATSNSIMNFLKVNKNEKM